MHNHLPSDMSTIHSYKSAGICILYGIGRHMDISTEDQHAKNNSINFLYLNPSDVANRFGTDMFEGSDGAIHFTLKSNISLNICETERSVSIYISYNKIAKISYITIQVNSFNDSININEIIAIEHSAYDRGRNARLGLCNKENQCKLIGSYNNRDKCKSSIRWKYDLDNHKHETCSLVQMTQHILLAFTKEFAGYDYVKITDTSHGNDGLALSDGMWCIEMQSSQNDETADQFIESHKREIYGLLTGDEGYNSVPDTCLSHIERKWGSRKYFSARVYGRGVLLINLKNSKDKENCRNQTKMYYQEAWKSDVPQRIGKCYISGMDHDIYRKMQKAVISDSILKCCERHIRNSRRLLVGMDSLFISKQVGNPSDIDITLNELRVSLYNSALSYGKLRSNLMRTGCPELDEFGTLLKKELDLEQRADWARGELKAISAELNYFDEKVSSQRQILTLSELKSLGEYQSEILSKLSTLVEKQSESDEQQHKIHSSIRMLYFIITPIYVLDLISKIISINIHDLKWLQLKSNGVEEIIIFSISLFIVMVISLIPYINKKKSRKISNH